jgi:alpha-L-arabinofuranosidase
MRRLIVTLLVLLSVSVGGWAGDIDIHVNVADEGKPVSRYLAGSCIEDVNHEIYGGLYSQMIFGESFQEPATAATTFLPAVAGDISVSRMWGPIQTGAASLKANIIGEHPFVGTQCQRITFAGGHGAVGIENRGLNRQGIAIKEGKPYEGHLWLRSDSRVTVVISLESFDGMESVCAASLKVTDSAWKRYDFSLTPNTDIARGQFSIRLSQPATVDVGYAFLQPGEWGRFKSQPVRRDVAEALVDQGITVLRYGGSMVNALEYRWKKMIGPRDRRPPYAGHWYQWSSNGWGILDFLDFCQAAGFLAIPDFNIDETPQDMADFVEYANGSTDTPWGRIRAANGHPRPYDIHHIELGNEEKVDNAYREKFEKLARAVWQKDPDMIPVVGDFQYEQPIADPMHFQGADSGITSLAAHQQILEFARQQNHEVWFDVHVWTDGPEPSASARALESYVRAIAKVANGARQHVVVFELNANNHDQRRALANAATISAIIRDGRVPVVLSANALQVDHQNDNGWDQGLIFLNPSQVWIQPPGYLTQMIAGMLKPVALDAVVEGADDTFSVTATRSAGHEQVFLLVTNRSDESKLSHIHLDAFDPSSPTASVQTLSGVLNAHNTADASETITPKQSVWRHELDGGAANYRFPSNSVTVICFH